jgi:hypothetical protein
MFLYRDKYEVKERGGKIIHLLVIIQKTSSPCSTVPTVRNRGWDIFHNILLKFKESMINSIRSNDPTKSEQLFQNHEEFISYV